MLDHPNLRPADEPISSVHPEDTNILNTLSPARLAANRANALRSTGPSTPEEKPGAVTEKPTLGSRL